MSSFVLNGSSAEVNALLYGSKHPQTMQYLQNNYDRFAQNFQSMGETMSQAAQSFYQGAQQLYDKFHNSEIIAAAQRAVRKIQAGFQMDVISSLYDLPLIQTAPLTMQRFVMAEPTIRALYHRQLCDGYSDSYVDMHPGQIGEQHYDYRRVMQDVVVENEEGWQSTHYFDELIENDRELTLQEQLDVMSTWDAIKHYVSIGEDPTSPLGAKL